MKSRALIVLAALAFATPALAQEGNNKAAAEALFDEGLKLFDKGKVADACPKFAASYKLDPASGTLLNVGRCYEKIGKTATAWTAYRELIGLAHSENNPKREATAKQLEEKIRPRLTKLTLVTAGAAPAGLLVKIDHVDIDVAQLGTPVPIDPGDHNVEASAPNKLPWSREIKLVDGESVSVAIPTLDDAPVAPPPAPVAPPATKAEEGGTSPLKIAAIGVGGLGVVGLALGGVFGGIALGHASTAREHCVPPRPCDGEGLAARDDARSTADVSTIALIAGGALLAGGVVLWLVAPKTRSTTGIDAHGLLVRF